MSLLTSVVLYFSFNFKLNFKAAIVCGADILLTLNVTLLFFGFTILQSLDWHIYCCINTTRFPTNWRQFLAAVQTNSAVTQITTVVIILIFGVFWTWAKMPLCNTQSPGRKLNETELSQCFYLKYTENHHRLRLKSNIHSLSFTSDVIEVPSQH